MVFFFFFIRNVYQHYSKGNSHFSKIPKVSLISFRKPSRQSHHAKGHQEEPHFQVEATLRQVSPEIAQTLAPFPWWRLCVKSPCPPLDIFPLLPAVSLCHLTWRFRLKSPKISFLTDTLNCPSFFYEHKQVILSILTKVLKAEWKEKPTNKQNYITHDSYHYQALIISC